MNHFMYAGLSLVLALAGCSSSSSGGGGGGDDPAEDPSYLVVLTAESEGEGGNGLWVYEIADDGELTGLSDSPVQPGFDFPRSLAVHPTLPLLVVGDEDEDDTTGDVHLFEMADDGSVEELSASPVDVNAEVSICQVALGQDGESLFVVHSPIDPIVLESFSLNAETGALTLLGTSDDVSGTCTDDLVAHPVEEVLYVSDGQFGTVEAYSIAGDGSIALLGTEVAVNDTALPGDAAVTLDGEYLYVVDAGGEGDFVVGFTLGSDGTIGDKVDVDDEPVTADPGFLAVHPDNTFLYVASFNTDEDVPSDDELAIFSINASTGALTPISGSPFSMLDGVGAMAYSPEGDYLFMANTLAGTVQVFAVDSSTGALTEISGSPFDGGVIPFALQVVQP